MTMTTAQPGQEQRMEPSAIERQVDAVIDAARNVEWEAHFGANWATRAKELAKAREHLLAFAARPTADRLILYREALELARPYVEANADRTSRMTAHHKGADVLDKIDAVLSRSGG